ncbi:hypothetical protein [Crossiella sp. CA198]|uniref:hypothetical protein n=1 Tax=Crossiella sp. CA198 TaxID=3455607 RepID=UPI003F8D2C65
MSRQLDVALSDMDRAMKLVRDALAGIPFNRKSFLGLHDALTQSMAVLTVETSHARAQLPR